MKAALIEITVATTNEADTNEALERASKLIKEGFLKPGAGRVEELAEWEKLSQKTVQRFVLFE